jgi:hypothetical protein
MKRAVSKKEKKMKFVVMEPKKVNGVVKIVPVLLTEDQDKAVRRGKDTRQGLRNKGFESWALKVKVRGISCKAAYEFHAKLFLEYGHYLDSISNGNSFMGQQLIDWGNELNNA